MDGPIDTKKLVARVGESPGLSDELRHELLATIKALADAANDHEQRIRRLEDKTSGRGLRTALHGG